MDARDDGDDMRGWADGMRDRLDADGEARLDVDGAGRADGMLPVAGRAGRVFAPPDGGRAGNVVAPPPGGLAMGCSGLGRFSPVPGGGTTTTPGG